MRDLIRSPYLGLGGGGGGYRHPGAGGNATSANGRSLWASESADAHCAEYGGFGGGAGGYGGGGGGGFSGAYFVLSLLGKDGPDRKLWLEALLCRRRGRGWGA